MGTARRPHPPAGSRDVGPQRDPAAGRGAGSGRPLLTRRVTGRPERGVLRVRSLARRSSLHDRRRWVGSHEDLLRHGRLSRRLGGERSHRGDPGARLGRACRVPHGAGRERSTAGGDPARSSGEVHLLRGAQLVARRLADRLRCTAEHPAGRPLGCRSRRLRSRPAHDDRHAATSTARCGLRTGRGIVFTAARAGRRSNLGPEWRPLPRRSRRHRRRSPDRHEAA